ncbi:MAG TPA: cell surface protein, partial [Planctomycetaceae bacterium]|nr:cell surface protein [Planctomycetaceae bacterium]
MATTATAADSPLSSLVVYPGSVKLTTKRDRQSLIVQATFANGLTRDVTGEAKFVLADDKAATLSGHLLTPKADGKGELSVSYGGRTIRVPIEVEKAADDRPISFRLDVMPVFMKANCNTGSCHGSARGKDGFRLSLFGFDPAGDHYRLTRELPGRRINLAVPSSSLLMEKSVGEVPHTGGKRFGKDSELYGTLDRWLVAGAPNDPGAVPAVTKVELFPKEAVLDGEGVTQQLNVLAHYADGTTR